MGFNPNPNPNPNSSCATKDSEEPPSSSSSPPPSSSSSSGSSAGSVLGAKWWGFVSALWVQCVSGNNYTFSNYSVELKAVLGCNQVQLNGLSSAKDVGKAFGLFAGILSDYLPPWSILLIGSLEGLLGYGVQWLVISRRISPLPYWLMCVVMCMGGNSTTWMNTAVLVTCMRNFKGSRGPAAGILKAYVGLSTAIFTDLCTALFTGDAAAFVLMLAVLPFAVCIVAMFLLRPVPMSLHHHRRNNIAGDDEKEESRCFALLNSAAVLLALYLLAIDLSGISSSSSSAAGIALLLASPAALPIYLHFKAPREPIKPESESESEQQHSLKDPLLLKASCDASNGPPPASDSDASSAAAAAAAKKKKKKPQDEDGDYDEESNAAATADANGENQKKKQQGRRLEIGEDHTFSEALSTSAFWLLFACFLCGVGNAMAFINNTGQIGESLGYASVSIFVSMISIWGFFGRLGSGALTEWLIRWKGIPRPALLALSQLVMVGGYAFLAVGIEGSLFVGSIVVGICYGVRLAVSVPTVSELFGLKIFGLMYNVLILNLPLGSFLFSSLLAGFLYDLEAAKQAAEDDDDQASSSTLCSGVHCYRTVFIVMAAVSMLGFFLDVLLTLRTRKLYASIRRAKLAAAQTIS